MYKVKVYALLVAVACMLWALAACAPAADTQEPDLQDQGAPSVNGPGEGEDTPTELEGGVSSYTRWESEVSEGLHRPIQVGGSDWGPVGDLVPAVNSRFNFVMWFPEDWAVEARAENGDGYYIDPGAEVDMRVYGEHMVLDLDHYRANWENMGDLERFTFIDDAEGYTLSSEGITIYLRPEGDSLLVFYANYASDPAWYADNAGLIASLASFLQPVDGREIPQD